MFRFQTFLVEARKDEKKKVRELWNRRIGEIYDNGEDRIEIDVNFINKLFSLLDEINRLTPSEIEKTMLPPYEELNHIRKGSLWKDMNNFRYDTDRPNVIELEDVIQVYFYKELKELAKQTNNTPTNLVYTDGEAINVYFVRDVSDSVRFGRKARAPWCISGEGNSYFGNYRNDRTFWFLEDNGEHYMLQRDDDKRPEQKIKYWDEENDLYKMTMEDLRDSLQKRGGGPVPRNLFQFVSKNDVSDYLDEFSVSADSSRAARKVRELERQVEEIRRRRREKVETKLRNPNDFFDFDEDEKREYIEHKHEIPDDVLEKIREQGGRVNKELINNYMIIQDWKITPKVYNDVLNPSQKRRVVGKQLDRIRETFGNRNNFAYPSNAKSELLRYLNDDSEREAFFMGYIEFDDLKNPDNADIIAAIKEKPERIKNIPDSKLQKDDVIKEVIKLAPEYIEKVRRPSEELQLIVLEKDPKYLKEIQQVSKEVQMKAIIKNPMNIKYINNPEEDVQIKAVQVVPETLGDISNPKERAILIAVSRRPEQIKNISNPSREAQFAAVGKAANAIELIRKPDPMVILSMVSVDPKLIKRIDNLTKEQELVAVKNNPKTIEHINLPGEETIITALKKDPSVVKYVKNATKKTTMLAKILDANNHGSTDEKERKKLALVKEHPFAIRHIRNPSVKLKFEAVRQSLFALKYIENPPEDLQLAAIEKNPHALEYIKNPTEKAQEAAIEQDPFLIKTIKRPSRAVQLAAVQKYPKSIKMIQRPYPEVVKYVEEHHT